MQGDDLYITVTGAGTSTAPYVIHGLAAALGVVDSTFIDLTLTGGGTTSNPWSLTASLKTLNLDDISNVNAPSPANGNVLLYQSSSGNWVPGPPSTATPGAINVTNGISGDGSAGSPLGVRLLSGGRLRFSSGQVDLTLDTYAKLGLSYASAAARDAQYTAWGTVPAAGDHAFLQDAKSLTIYDGALWYVFNSGVGQSWQFDRSSPNAQDTWTGYATLLGPSTITSPRAGRYKITWCLSVASAQPSVFGGYARVTINGAIVDAPQYDCGFVLIPGGASFIYTHSGGNLQLSLGHDPGTNFARMQSAGCRMVVEYLGP